MKAGVTIDNKIGRAENEAGASFATAKIEAAVSDLRDFARAVNS